MKFEFAIDQDKIAKIVLRPDDDLEKTLINRIFGGNYKIELPPNTDQVVIKEELKKLSKGADFGPGA